MAAALISGLLVGGSYHYFEDAMYPNLMAAQFLLVLARSALFRLYDAPSVRGGTLLALLGSVVVFYHPVASMYEALLLAAISLSFLPYLLLRDRRRGLALFLSLALLFVISVFYAWDTYDLPQAVAGLLLGGSETGRGERPSVWRSVRSCRSGPRACSRRSRSRCCRWLSWARSSGDGPLEAGRDALRARTGDPVRMMPPPVHRQPDAALRLSPALRARPRHTALALLAAFAPVAVLQSVGWRKPLTLLAAGLTAVLGLYGAQLNFSDAAAPSWRLVITPPIAEAGDWLEEHNEGGNILVSPHLWNQVPSRMMLAIGDYSALQSFDEGQMRVPRDLPPTGAGPPRAYCGCSTTPKASARKKFSRNTTSGTLCSTRTFPTGIPWSTGSYSKRTPTSTG